ncbi:hypothetical protein [Kineosporia sp. NBRC 101731]|uniref:hypothetical protein n=1 Tax=Kineosporia sp. NBRC 101731 TaxID=3032199 RepID=UPI0024A09A26|nr:hypothetical protein [Kineosporia sp. NBRC 101731]GLY31193.1 hypothetical protein Kisp02_45580 [Kineosporia sp. NBRC 101731]
MTTPTNGPDQDVRNPDGLRTDEAVTAERRADQAARAAADRDAGAARDTKDAQDPVTAGRGTPQETSAQSRPSWPGPSAASSVGQAGPGERPVGGTVDETVDEGKSGESRTSWAGPTVVSPEQGDPSVREDYAHGEAHRRAGSGGVSGVGKDEVIGKDPVVTRVPAERPPQPDPVDTVSGSSDSGSSDSSVGTVPVNTDPAVGKTSDRDVVAGVAEGEKIDDTDAPSAPVTSINSGRRRSPAAPDAVDGVTDVTSDDEWRDLQAKFVDDPESTVTEAATLIERDLAGLRSKLAGGSTEDLRNAFKRYRGLHESLR